MRSSDLVAESPSMAGSGMLDLRGTFIPQPSKSTPLAPSPLSFDVASYTRILQHMAKLYPYDPAAVAASISSMGQSPYSMAFLGTNGCVQSQPLTSPVLPSLLSTEQRFPRPPSSVADIKEEVCSDETTFLPKALDLSTQGLNTQGLKTVYSSYRRITIDQVKPKIVEDVWVENDLQLTWTDSKIAAFNAAQKLFMCVDCEHVGFLSRVAEHWLGSHANLRVFHCPRCPYTSAWSRCVKMHLTRQHNEQFADTTMWKGNATLLEVTRLMQDLRTKVETRIDSNNLLADKRFYCPHCPYATDRRDLYTRHENIHKDDKPFHCYLCLKQFNRADHVKKHFVRMHADSEYDISKIRKAQNASKNHSPEQNGAIASLPSSKLLPNPSPPVIDKNTQLNTNQRGSESLTSLDNALRVDLNTETSNDSGSNSTCTNISVLSPPSGIPVIVKSSPSPPAQLVLRTERSTSPAEISGKNRRRGDKAFTCHYCNWSGSDNWCLKRHMNTHIKPFACVMCDYKAARAERLSTHVLKVHNKRICNKCNFLADTQEELQEHTREEHHNNPYSRRHICTTCGMSFDTRANLETHIHLSHTRPQSPADFVQITPILLPEVGNDVVQDLSLKQTKMDKEATMLICPVEECSEPCDSSSTLADHVRQFHGGLFASRCPHCQYRLTQDELAKDHWLTHHEDVCSACVHVFTSVYGPQLWKKVHVRPLSNESHLDAIVSGLNRKRTLGSDVIESDCESKGDSSPVDLDSPSPTSLPSSPFSENLEPESERCLKRPRKQSYPKKVIAVPSADSEIFSSNEEQVELTRKPVRKLLKKRRIKKCLKCHHKPKFSSMAQFRLHRFKRHKFAIKRPIRVK